MTPNEFVNKMPIKMSPKMIKARRLILFSKRDPRFKERTNAAALIKIQISKTV